MAVQYLTEGYVSVQRIESLLMQEEVESLAPWLAKTASLANDSTLAKDLDVQNKQLDVVTVSSNGNIEHIELSAIELSHSSPANLLNIVLEDATATDTDDVVVSVRNMTASWTNYELAKDDTNVLSGITMSILKNELIVVIGTVGSSKSSILMTILKELLPIAGTVEIPPNVTIGYCAQDHWIMSNTIRHNILFGREMDEVWYEKVVKCCALESDMQLMPHGDLTIIGDRGVNLSGGQRARIGLARAVYGKASLNLLDDPLSAVDPKVSSHLFHDVICGLLKGSTRVLVTHQIQYLSNPNISRIMIMDRGRIVALDTYKALHSSGQLDQWVTDVVVEDMRRRASSSNSVDSKAVPIPLSLHQSTAEETTAPLAEDCNSEEVEEDKLNITEGIIVTEDKALGGVGWDPYLDYIKYVGSKLEIIFIVV